jgi:S1-C subfamily serine protease
VPAGLLVRTVSPQGAAERAGVQVGDVIVRIEGQPAQSLEQLGVQSIRREPGQSIAITLSRQGREVNTEIAVP